MKDLPDYTREMVIKYTGGFIGLEELATRLGFIGPADLRGNVVLMEGFESELTEWTDAYCGLGGTATRSSRHKFSGDWAVKLFCDGTFHSTANLYRWFHFPGMSKYGIFARFCWDANCQVIYLNLALGSGIKEFAVEVQYDMPLTTLYISTTGGYHTVDTALNLSPLYAYAWFPILLTLDLNSSYYDKLYFADKEYDISDVPIDYTELGTNPGAMVRVEAFDYLTATFTTYVDDIIIAKNVP